MKVACYFAAAEGAHPNCSTSDYDKMWPVMQASVERQGYQLIHLTTWNDPARCEKVFRVDADPATVMFSREVAWLEFLYSLEDDEEAVLVEPDAYLLRPIPQLAIGADMMLLRRYKTLPCGFRLAKKSAIPFYEAVVREYDKMDREHKTFHGDAQTHHRLLGIGPRGARFEGYGSFMRWESVNIEIRDWLDYTSKLWRKAVAWNFKGDSKHIMLAMADGKMPAMR